MSLPRIVSAMVICSLSSASIPALSGVKKVQIVVETEILAPDPKAGMKSRQVIRVGFDNNKVIDFFETGVTEILGGELASVRDRFSVTDVNYDAQSASFVATGETASGVLIMPNINYRFAFKVRRSGEVELSGCHDGYPAYRIYVDGVERYLFKHDSIDLLKLFGDCDIEAKI